MPRHRSAFLLLAYAFAAIMAGTTLPGRHACAVESPERFADLLVAKTPD